MSISVSIPLSNHTWLPLNHRHGPCSPFSPETIPTAAAADMLRGDQHRADTIRKRLNGTAAAKHGADVSIPTKLGCSLNTLEYVVTVGLGTPAITQTVHIDTGSDITWVQCRPCPATTCHTQKDKLFNPAMSATYFAFGCRSAACRSLRRDLYNNGCSRHRRHCQYIVKYGDGSNTTGTYSSDKLTLISNHAVVDHFQFGCSHVTQLFTGDKADGLMDLGGGLPSLVSQMKTKAFSYCLPPAASYSGFLTLGVPPPPPRMSSTNKFAMTPMYRSDVVDTFYLVRLQGIAVAGRRLRVPSSAFTAGAVMDSGTMITRLPETAYRALRAAFRKEMRMYKRVSSSTILDTCFNFSAAAGGEDDVKVPSVELVFERGATVELDRSGIILDGCLAFASTGDDESAGIIGNVQQRTHEVMYDVGGGAVGFRRGAC
nr:unnamed protein product [Digitaria exilis]